MAHNTMSAPFLPIITVAVLVMPKSTVGVMEESITHSRPELALAQALAHYSAGVGSTHSIA